MFTKFLVIAATLLSTQVYGSCIGLDRSLNWSGQRDRRLSADGAEERAIRSVLAEKGCPAELMLFEMALESAMRLREMYTLTKDQVHMDKSTIFLDKTKNGDKRQVPMSSVLKATLKVYMATVEGENLYPWWDGRLDEAYLDGISNRLSKRFAYRFKEAKCPDLRFHDLRPRVVFMNAPHSVIWRLPRSPGTKTRGC